jgi:large subunit ribosomal protein L23
MQTQMHRDNRHRTHAAEKPDEKSRKAFKEQAEELKKDKEAWRPTWKALGIDFAHKEMANTRRSGIRPPKWMAKP